MCDNKKGSDINVGNIEEDIKVLKNIEKLRRIEFKHYVTDREEQALKNILLYYTKQMQTNEELRKKVKELGNYINPSKARISYFDTKKGANVVIEGFIPKQKIKAKIEELKYRADGIAGTYQYADSQEHLQEKKKIVIELRTKVEVLEELLKEVNK